MPVVLSECLLSIAVSHFRLMICDDSWTNCARFLGSEDNDEGGLEIRGFDLGGRLLIAWGRGWRGLRPSP